MLEFDWDRPAVVGGRKNTKRKINSKKFIQRWAWDWDIKKMSNDKVFMAASDVHDMVASDVMVKRLGLPESTIIKQISFLCNKREWSAFVKENFPWKIFESTETRGMLINEADGTLVQYETHPSSVELRIFSTQETIDSIVELCSSKFETVDCYIEWMYSGDGGSIDIPLRPDKLPISEMYPFLEGESLEDYYDRFMDSTSSILLLIGPPGTGKTSFIRGLLQHRKSSAVVTYDAGILDKDYVFARFIEGEAEVMVLEDADAFLRSRKEGNTMMHKFLNVGDGLVTTKGKKLIFSTNLPSVKDIDPALVRPGRCFDILTFDNLTQAQAEKAAKALDITLKGKKNVWSVADLFHEQAHSSKKVETKIGFV